MAGTSISLDGPREDLLAEGILGILAPAVEHVDQRIGEVRYVARISSVCYLRHQLALFNRKSQADLREQIDQLADGRSVCIKSLNLQTIRE